MNQEQSLILHTCTMGKRTCPSSLKVNLEEYS
jgi:hypothetical protein